MTYSTQLSKSRYLDGKQCLKKLYLKKHHKDLATPFSKSQEAIFKQGHSVGFWAHRRFPNGKDATPEPYYNYGPSIEKTAAWIAAGEKVIYEASFSYDGVYAALDLYIQKNGKRIAIEVKSSTGVKDYHLEDAAIQYWIMNNAGFTPDEFYLMHINNKYVRAGEIDPKKLFSYADITQEVKAKQDGITAEVANMKAVLAQEEIPEQPIGPHCNTPFDCEFKAHCWQQVPENAVFELCRIGATAWDFAEKGIWSMADLNAADFSGKQQLQIEGVQEGKKHIEKEKIDAFLEEWEYPLYFFDFESINPALPLYQGTSPFQQIPVQYSLHVLEKEGASLQHIEFLADFKQDPRIDLIKPMLEELGNKGSIVTYNRAFEKGIVKRLAADFPAHQHALENISERMVDLWIPFKNAWYYTPEMCGSASIKAVLPAVCPNHEELSYASLAIGDGSSAMIMLQALAEDRIKAEEVKKLRQDLLAYCKLDTLAMVKIWEVMKKLDKN